MSPTVRHDLAHVEVDAVTARGLESAVYFDRL
jgi:hypothetical protein